MGKNKGGNAGGGNKNAGKSGGKSGGKKNNNQEESKSDGKLKTCNKVKARHILCEKHSRILEAYNLLTEEHGSSPPSAEFGRVAETYSECSSGKKGGDLGWFPRGKMVGPFQEIAFSLTPGSMSDIFKTTHGYHIVLVEGRKA
mmetsp:Transcript_13212/g.14584  ORF Transcript_13212/g.14584 Transcript_13212/m.14584 type:complete len:143 (+) Transcript_13212:67-495(+)